MIRSATTSGRTRIKICGLRTEGDVRAAVAAGADAVGFVFARSSPRYIEPQEAAELASLLPLFVQPVGVFAEASAEEIAEAADEACVQIVQVHGRRSEEEIEHLHEEFAIIRAIEFSPKEVRRWGRSEVDLLLVDGSGGGAGRVLPWEELAAVRSEIRVPLMLAGGLTPHNVAEATRIVQPFGVDVSSGVEQERGRKDEALMAAFCRAVQRADLDLLDDDR